MTTVETLYVPSTLKDHLIHTIIWKVESPRAVIHISHGMAEHIARYDEFARYMNEHGIAVVGGSHLGHGLTAKSENELGYIADRNGWDHMVRDVHEVRKAAQAIYPNVPYILLGHSMGSFIARTYLTKPYAEGLAGAIISGTANQPAIIVGAGKLIDNFVKLFKGRHHRSKLLNSMSFGSYNRSFKPNRTEYDWLSRNEESVDKYVADPLCGFCFTAGAFGDLFDGLKYIGKKRNLRRINKSLPCLFIAGYMDPVGNNGKGVAQVADNFRKAGIKDVEMKLYPDARHEVLNEVNRLEVYGDLLNFVSRII